MTDLSHPLTPWTHEECLSLVKAQIARNVAERDRRIVALYAAGKGSWTIGKMFDLSPDTVIKIVRRTDPTLIRPSKGRGAVAA